MVNVLQRNSSQKSNTSTHRGLDEEVCFTGGGTTQLLLCHIIKSRKRQVRASPIPVLCLSFVSKTVWQWPPVGTGDGDRALPAGWDPAAGPRQAENRLGGGAVKALLRKQLLTAGKGKKAKPGHQKKLQGKNHGCCRGSQTGEMLEQPHNTNSTCRNISVLQEVNPKLPLGLKLGTQKSRDVGSLQSHSLNLKNKRLGSNSAVTLCRQHLPHLAENPNDQWLIHGKLWNLLHLHRKWIYF